MSAAAVEEAPVETPALEATEVPEETEAPVETAAPEVTEAPTAVPETSMTLKAPANEEEAKNVVVAAETDNWVRKALLLSGVNAGKETNANNPESGKPPLVLYPDKCWFCGCCVEDCPAGAAEFHHPLGQRIPRKRKETGEMFRTDMEELYPPPGRKPYF